MKWNKGNAIRSKRRKERQETKKDGLISHPVSNIKKCGW
jgi:hypothetical protein